MLEKLQDVERRFDRLTAELSSPETLADSARFARVAKERAGLEPLVETFRAYRKLKDDIAQVEEWLEGSDPEAREMAREELPQLRRREDELERSLHRLLLPRDPNDDKNVILEVRAGAGGDEAGLFAEELLQMYLRYADRKGWRTELLDLSSGNAGGVKDASAMISGEAVYGWLKYESGVHRVQRVPATEAQGRIHTSTVTVAVMPEAEEVDVQVRPDDVDLQVMRSTGAGGQSVNTTDSAVRLTHRPSGIVVKCQQEKSQTKNRAMAMRMLRAKLFELELDRQSRERDALRRGQVGTGDRSEKIRTYNFPQDRLTDHRIGITWHNLTARMAGDIDEVVTACRTYFQAERLKAEGLAPGTRA
ncbi:MAG TPA: peptide chain release factor 1 [Myxococcaceae bacterium]|jgi:peptide chain release factor 1|nr:peptide chain release factor 1 [Myxococcaceae bacterium]